MTFIGINIELYFNEVKKVSLNMFSLNCIGQAGPKAFLAKNYYRQKELKLILALGRTKMQKYNIVQHNFSIFQNFKMKIETTT